MVCGGLLLTALLAAWRKISFRKSNTTSMDSNELVGLMWDVIRFRMRRLQIDRCERAT